MTDNRLAEFIGRACTQALIAEVSATPKPGLVDKDNSGSHRDMDFDTFITSITTISPYFSVFAQRGTELAALDEASLSHIRHIGVDCEEAMFAATHGVNTHKGAIFSLGIIAAAAGHCAVRKQDLRAETVCAAAATIAAAAQRDFEELPAHEPMTKGRELYIKYGIRGIRGEAADGFPSVRTEALPTLRRLVAEGVHTVNDICLEVLLQLMSTVDDTNVAARCGAPAMGLLHLEARRILACGGALTSQGISMMNDLNCSFVQRNISPGGCADLLSVTVALYEIEKLSVKVEDKCYAR
ncbi:MAG: triphosphoribosyl-dephospho-CoA synthase CitG [Angelakisella sp.]